LHISEISVNFKEKHFPKMMKENVSFKFPEDRSCHSCLIFAIFKVKAERPAIQYIEHFFSYGTWDYLFGSSVSDKVHSWTELKWRFPFTSQLEWPPFLNE